MFAEVYGAYEKEEPWLGYMWGTGDPALKLDLVRLEEPPYSRGVLGLRTRPAPSRSHSFS